MKRYELMDILENIQVKNNKENIGSNEAELSTREDIADLFFALFNKANEANKQPDTKALDLLAVINCPICGGETHQICYKCTKDLCSPLTLD